MRRLLELELKNGVLIERVNRFAVRVSTAGREVLLHNRNTGKLGDLLVPGAEVLYVERRGWERRRTSGVLVGVAVTEGDAALTDPYLQARSFEVAWESDLIRWLSGWELARREVSVMGVRLDYEIASASDGRGYLELKSAVFHDGSGTCMYPDVPSVRGRRHLMALERLAAKGVRSIVAFVAAHPLCRRFRPCEPCDPELAELLRRSAERGVEVRAVSMGLRRDGAVVLLSDDLPVSLA
ncbi:MAG: DNA/RNA nuclease SfsA [Nitrososphaerota archaeon]